MKKVFLPAWKKPGPKRLLLLYLLGAVMLLTASVLVGLYLQARHEREIASLKTKFERIEVGMNRKQVEDLIGRAPDDKVNYADGVNRVDVSWTINGYELDVTCTLDGVINRKSLGELWKPGLADYFELIINSLWELMPKRGR